MSNPEVSPHKRKAELENCEEENLKRSKIECSSSPLESSGQENIEDTYSIDETLTDATSEKANEVDEVQV